MKETKKNVKRNGRNVNGSVAIITSYALYKAIDLCGPVDKCLWMGIPSTDTYPSAGYDNFRDPRGQSSIDWVRNIVREWKDVQGLPPAKFAIGVPLYGESATGAQIPYFKLVEMGADPKGKGSFAGYFFDSQPVLQDKIDLSNNEGLGGHMAWSLRSDLRPRTRFPSSTGEQFSESAKHDASYFCYTKHRGGTNMIVLPLWRI
ncbi:hypothetical protein FOZ61_010404 [Perkinsus olseni]|uniref:Chitinase n=1 Tax=Perkinsus olseni TaxID=32597 RepID=A0A7J6KXB1_PEROL|nr:hypothetical protein FOZ61_010404 [Perkinsus olseni]KAF4652962.1 hypothetical protein FOL46_009417 [Perkinsus olseni]